MDFRIMGPLEVLAEGRILDVGGGKQRSLLALLLLHANEVVSSDRLIDELWPDEPPPSAAKIVQVHVSRLRKALDAQGNGVLLTRGRGYLLRVEPGQLDLDRFRSLLDTGRDALAAGDPDDAARTLRDALALWRGPPLGDFAYDSFAQEEISGLEELRLAALEERIDADLALGRHNEVIQELERLVRQHPLRERLQGQLMLALYRAGRQAEALEVYRGARRTLADELGLEPSPFLQQLERAILTHDDAVQAPARRRDDQWIRSRGGLFIAAGALVLLAAATAVAVIELTGKSSAGLASVAADSVGVIDPDTNKIVGQIPVGATPTAIEFGSHRVWVISQQDKTVTRIDAKTRMALRTIAVGAPPVDVTVGKDAVWVLVSAQRSLAGGPARIVRIDPALNDVLLTIPLGLGSLGYGSGPGQSLAAAGGTVWVINPYPRPALSRIDADTNTVKTTFGLATPSYGPNTGTAGGVLGASGLAVGEGAVWVGSDVGVSRIGPRSNSVAATIRLGVTPPAALAVGEGAVWVGARPIFRCCPPETVGSGTLTRIDPATNLVETTIPIGGQPVDVAVGEGSVWIADPGTRSVVRVDPEENRVVARIRVGARPRGIAVGDGSVWISVG
jgi:YVTN family beta-propeller protein